MDTIRGLWHEAQLWLWAHPATNPHGGIKTISGVCSILKGSHLVLGVFVVDCSMGRLWRTRGVIQLRVPRFHHGPCSLGHHGDGPSLLLQKAHDFRVVYRRQIQFFQEVRMIFLHGRFMFIRPQTKKCRGLKAHHVDTPLFHLSRRISHSATEKQAYEMDTSSTYLIL